MKRAVRSYSSLAALLGVVAGGIASLLSPRVLGILHHYANFVAVGRSSVKLAVLGAYAFALFAVSLAPRLLSPARAKRLFTHALYGALCLTLSSTLFMAALIAKLDVPIRSSLYAVNAQEFSFGHLTHSHLYRPVGYLLRPFVNAEVGTAWFDVARAFFGIPGWALIAFFVALGIALAWLALVSLAYAQTLRGVALKLLYLVASLAVIKSLVDGAFLDASALLGVAVLGLLLRNRLLALLPIPFLIADWFLWFTPDYLAQLGVTVALLAGLFLWHLAGTTAGRRRVAAAAGAIACLVAFLWGGALIPFFGAHAAPAAVIGGADDPVIPAGAPVWYQARGATWPTQVTTTAETRVSAFVSGRDLAFESPAESVKLPGITCDPTYQKRILNSVRIFAPGGELTEPFTVGDWITARRTEGRFALRMNSCLPNTLPSLVRGVHTIRPDEVLIFAFLR